MVLRQELCQLNVPRSQFTDHLTLIWQYSETTTVPYSTQRVQLKREDELHNLARMVMPSSGTLKCCLKFFFERTRPKKTIRFSRRQAGTFAQCHILPSKPELSNIRPARQIKSFCRLYLVLHYTCVLQAIQLLTEGGLGRQGILWGKKVGNISEVHIIIMWSALLKELLFSTFSISFFSSYCNPFQIHHLTSVCHFLRQQVRENHIGFLREFLR